MVRFGHLAKRDHIHSHAVPDTGSQGCFGGLSGGGQLDLETPCSDAPQAQALLNCTVKTALHAVATSCMYPVKLCDVPAQGHSCSITTKYHTRKPRLSEPSRAHAM